MIVGEVKGVEVGELVGGIEEWFNVCQPTSIEV